ncbi:Type II secretion system (T2SS), protein F [Nocardioides alpinus]|uniref:Type II secretion system (T2SS), protein F n=1 Tax=Nocardioides alpinus TaxID=748909 RepID=A0A1I0ZFQ3_9ACTN|nr:type II secretion system F family protein [Nocardioides alpinus]PKH40681.1 type II secretion system protein [Nocardioides alpinus]SFB23360.1 Type II secretion system (T2SS), protein F [Nocardioides alpinus]
MTWLSGLCAAAAVLWWFPSLPRAPRDRARSGVSLRPVAAVGVGVLAWLFVGGALAPVAGVVASVLSWRVLAGAEAPTWRREREELERTLPHLIALFASTLRSGAEPVAGLAQVCAALPGPAARRLAPVVEQARWGASGVEAWSAVAADEALGPLARVMVRSQTSGASVVQAVERLADEIERESLATAEDAARRVGVAAAIPLGVCLLPAFLLLGVVPTVAALFGSVAP